MKIWAKTKEFSEGKYLVLRRDGTVVDWAHFVMGARDEASAAGLRAYAEKARELGYDPAYCDSVHELADDFQVSAAFAKDHPLPDRNPPDGAPHRKDDEGILKLMRSGGRVHTLSSEAPAVQTHWKMMAQERD